MAGRAQSRRPAQSMCPPRRWWPKQVGRPRRVGALQALSLPACRQPDVRASSNASRGGDSKKAAQPVPGARSLPDPGAVRPAGPHHHHLLFARGRDFWVIVEGPSRGSATAAAKCRKVTSGGRPAARREEVPGVSRPPPYPAGGRAWTLESPTPHVSQVSAVGLSAGVRVITCLFGFCARQRRSPFSARQAQPCRPRLQTLIVVKQGFSTPFNIDASPPSSRSSLHLFRSLYHLPDPSPAHVKLLL